MYFFSTRLQCFHYLSGECFCMWKRKAYRVVVLRISLLGFLLMTLIHLGLSRNPDPVTIEIIPDRKEYRFAGPGTIYEALEKEGQGTVTLTPSEGLIAGEAFNLQIQYTVGEEPLQPGDAFVVIIPYPFSRPTYINPTLAAETNRTHQQQTDGLQNGFSRVWCSNADVRLSIFCNPFFDNSRLGEGWHIIVTVDNAVLKTGETITVSYGDGKYGSPGALTHLAQEYEFASLIYRQIDWKTIKQDFEAEKRGRVYNYAKEHYFVENSPLIKVNGAQAENFIVTVPSRVQTGTEFELKVVARDRFGNVANFHEGTAAFEYQPELMLPEVFDFTKRDRGIKSFVCEARGSGTYTVKVHARYNRITGESNPVIVADNRAPKQLYWGDLHVHTIDSDGLGTVSAAYRYGRDAADLDFCAITDHLDGVTPIIRKNAEAYNDPGRFVTFNAFEQSGIAEGGGDIILYFKQADVKYEQMLPNRRAYSARINIDQIADIVDGMNKQDIIIIPHNHGGNYSEFREGFANEAVRLIEIYSVWGNSEQAEVKYRPFHWGKKPRSVQQALAWKYMVGIMASGDEHAGKAGYGSWLRRRKAWQSGLVGAYSTSLTRDGLWEALWNRQVYGTTGARMILDVSLNGHPMGSILNASGNHRRRLAVSVTGTEEIKEIHIIKNNKSIHQVNPVGRTASLTYTDTAPNTDFDYYYVRVVQEDTELAWSSPIWIIE